MLYVWPGIWGLHPNGLIDSLLTATGGRSNSRLMNHRGWVLIMRAWDPCGVHGNEESCVLITRCVSLIILVPCISCHTVCFTAWGKEWTQKITSNVNLTKKLKYEKEHNVPSWREQQNWAACHLCNADCLELIWVPDKYENDETCWLKFVSKKS